MKVAVIMGSDSDWDVMENCVKQLKEFGIEADVNVLSAHRTPDDLHDYVASAGANNIGVFIAAAGLSAALAGTIAAHTSLPVIGVPIAAGALKGVDALLSTVQMPPGVPVACMGIGKPGAKNAAVLAAQILALGDEGLTAKLADFKRDQTEAVRAKNEKLRKKI